MSTITASRSSRTSVRAATCATRLERFLLSSAQALPPLVEHRMDRRAARRARAPVAHERVAHDELRGTAAGALHSGIRLL